MNVLAVTGARAMSQNNRKKQNEKRRAEEERLAARRRERHAASPNDPIRDAEAPDQRSPIVAELIVRAVQAHFDDDQFGLDLIVDRLSQLGGSDAAARLGLAGASLTDGDVLSIVLAEALSRRLQVCWASGWQPMDVVRVVARLESSIVSEVAAGAVVDDAERHWGQPVHPQWSAQLEELEPWWAERSPTRSTWLGRCARTVGVGLREVIEHVVVLLARLQRLPILPLLIPPPGPGAALAAQGRRASGEIDAKVLGRVRGLLAKAESTEFPEEADALTEKAQELMTRHSIDVAMVAAANTDAGGESLPQARRIHLDAPYVEAKAMLVGAVASANRSRAVLAAELGFVTVFGFDTDLAVIDVLFTSLLAQATTSMVVAGRIVSKTGVSKTRSFRQSFLVSYASRIGERLREAAATSTHDAEADFGAAMLPVLVRREADVEDAVAVAFPSIRKIRTRVGNEAGWHAGRIAADQASFDSFAKLHSTVPDRA